MPLDALRDALSQLRLRLLDLTSRNRLLNFKHTLGKSLQFVDSDIDAVYRKLFSGGEAVVALNPIPEPDRKHWVDIDGRVQRPEVKDTARSLGINANFELARHPGNDAL